MWGLVGGIGQWGLRCVSYPLPPSVSLCCLIGLSEQALDSVELCLTAGPQRWSKLALYRRWEPRYHAAEHMGSISLWTSEPGHKPSQYALRTPHCKLYFASTEDKEVWSFLEDP